MKRMCRRGGGDGDGNEEAAVLDEECFVLLEREGWLKRGFGGADGGYWQVNVARNYLSGNLLRSSSLRGRQTEDALASVPKLPIT